MAQRTEGSAIRSILDVKKPFIIVDIGSNWRGSLEIAMDQIEQAAACGADAIKFQMFTHKELYGVDGPDVWPIKPSYLPHLKAKCDSLGKEFMCTAFSAEGVRYVDKYVRIHKIASAEMMHRGILNAVLETKKSFLVSTGGANESELIQFNRHVIDVTQDNRMGLLECVASYPAKATDYNLWQVRRGRCIGVSDHTISNVMAIAAAGAGAWVFEKHFDCFNGDYDTLTPDSPHSIGPAEFRQYVKDIRETWIMNREIPKAPAESEAAFVAKSRREPGDTTFRRL